MKTALTTGPRNQPHTGGTRKHLRLTGIVLHCIVCKSCYRSEQQTVLDCREYMRFCQQWRWSQQRRSCTLLQRCPPPQLMQFRYCRGNKLTLQCKHSNSLQRIAGKQSRQPQKTCPSRMIGILLMK